MKNQLKLVPLLCAVYMFVVCMPVQQANAYTWSLDAAEHVASGYPADMAVSEDLDHDGYPDLAFVSKSANNISVLLGQPPALKSWSLVAAVSYPTGDAQAEPEHIALGDFDGDGNSDLVISNYYMDNPSKCSISVAMGDGSAAFGAYTSFKTGLWPKDVGVADFNRDGRQDVLVVCDNNTNSGLYVHLNTGGSFKAHPDAGVVYTRLDTNVDGLAIGDFNEDGKMDVATVYYDIDAVDFRLAVMLGNGAGGFTKNDEMVVGSWVTHIACGDINLDGKLDLVAPSSTDGKLSVFLGAGDGTFGTDIGIDLPYAHDATITDMDGDGLPDIVVGLKPGPGVKVLTGKGDGTFNTPQSFNAASGGSFYLLVADINRDSLPDVVTGSSTGDGFDILTGSVSGRGTYDIADKVDYATGSSPEEPIIADMNRDGNPDLIVVDDMGSTISYYPGAGDGTFGTRQTTNVGSNPQQACVADFDRNGDLDIAVTNRNQDYLSVLMGDGSGNFGVSAASVPTYSKGIATTDFNSDGKADLAVTYYGASVNGTSVSILLGDGSGGFTAQTPLTTNRGPWSVAAGDFNQDGRPDLAVTHENDSGVSIFLGNGDGSFNDKIDYTAFDSADTTEAINVADVDRDGRSDLMVYCRVDGSVYFMKGVGDGSFYAPDKVYDFKSLGIYPNGSVVFVDLNRDGKLDFVTAGHGGSPSACYAMGDGAGGFGSLGTKAAGSQPQGVAVADLNHDGFMDIVAANYNANTVSVYLGQLDVPALTTATSPAEAGSVDVTEAGPYMPDSVVHIEAVPNPGWEFDRWSAGVADTGQAATTITMNSDKSVTAYFVRHGIETTVTEDGRYVNVSAVYYANGSPAPDGTTLALYRRYRAPSVVLWPEKWSAKGSAIVAGGAGAAVFNPLKVKNGEYQFRVGHAPVGATPVYSDVTQWTVSTVVITSETVSPSINSSPAVTWQEVPGAQGYYIQTSAVKTFIPVLGSEYRAGGSNTNGNIPALPAGVTMFWRVVPVLEDGISTAIPNKPKKIVYSPAP